MDTYEYPLGVRWKASTPEYAAVRVFGGKPADYIATVHEGPYTVCCGNPVRNRWVEVTTTAGEWIDDIPLVSE